MGRTPRLDRRQFLYGSAATASGMILTSCTANETSSDQGSGGDSDGGSGRGSQVDPLEVPGQFEEAPKLAEQVEAGELPPIDERLPVRPYVVPHNWLEPGKFGGDLKMITEGTDEGYNLQYMYGRSPLRWLNDGLDLGPGVIESWEPNDDSTEWTMHLREGLKWSDGEPVTSADIMYWWEDMVGNENHTAAPPDSARSGRGTPMELSTPDDVTLVMSFDSSTPLTPLLLANGTNWWDQIVPRHYAERFHPTYNDEVDSSSDWFTTHDEKLNFGINPDCPTLTGWRLRAYNEGRSLVWERNPYYWCVDRDGKQLPYIDTITVSSVRDPEVARLQIQEGDVDYVHGPFVPLSLQDVSSLRRTQERSGMEVLLWDSGSGTGSIFFFNYDHANPKLRELIREPKFRQALSHGFNREEARKSIYFETGEVTTGTYSPKAVEYQVNDEGGDVYRQWRDSYAAYDPDKAKALLDEIGVVDSNDDGVREMPDGSELTVRIDFPADAGDEHVQKNNLLERDWNAIGIDTMQNPVSPEAFSDQWESGKLMAHGAWEVGDGPDHLTGVWWFVPIEPARWAPLQGQQWAVRGTAEEDTEQDVAPHNRTPPRMEPEPDGPVARLWEMYAQAKAEPDEMTRHRLVWEMIKIHLEEGPFFQGTVANYPQLTVARQGLKNVPRREQLAQSGMVNTWAHPTPAVYDPETYFWQNPDEHT